MDFSEYTLTQLRQLKKELEEKIREKNKEEKQEKEKKEKEREEKFFGKVKNEDEILYLFNREQYSGIVEKANNKSVSVRFETDGKIHYIPYKHIVEIVSSSKE
jgi:adenylosuccinate lyase